MAEVPADSLAWADGSEGVHRPKGSIALASRAPIRGSFQRICERGAPPGAEAAAHQGCSLGRGVVDAGAPGALAPGTCAFGVGVDTGISSWAGRSQSAKVGLRAPVAHRNQLSTTAQAARCRQKPRPVPRDPTSFSSSRLRVAPATSRNPQPPRHKKSDPREPLVKLYTNSTQRSSALQLSQDEEEAAPRLLESRPEGKARPEGFEPSAKSLEGSRSIP